MTSDQFQELIRLVGAVSHLARAMQPHSHARRALYQAKALILSAAITSCPDRVRLQYQAQEGTHSLLLVTLLGPQIRSFHVPVGNLTDPAAQEVIWTIGEPAGYGATPADSGNFPPDAGRAA